MTSKSLADRLASLGVTVEEVASICRVPTEWVESWIADGPDAEAAVWLRWLDDDDDAQRRVEQVRGKRTESLLGREAAAAGVKSFPKGRC